jgi:isopenicillin N synthase-like dioxygenase
LRGGDGTARRDLARQFGHTFETFGFATIVGHGIADPTIQRAYDLANAFFDLPLDEKMRSALPDRVKNRGYVPAGVESVALTRGIDKPPDLVEALVFYALHLEAETLKPGTSAATGNLIPARPPELAAALRDYFVAVRNLSGDLMRLAALALDLPETYFEPFIDNRKGVLRLAYYPAQVDPPEPGQLRYGAHSDYGGFTILRQDDAPGGLQVELDGQWLDVTPHPGAFTINIGDLIARWTNDRWRSTLHRVVNPPREQAIARRLSLVFFSGPNDDARIECLPTCQSAANPAKYGPVVARQYVLSKLDRSMPAELETR